MSVSVGSTWGKWDLHVHTPASIVHHYPGDEDAAWDAFLSDLERLPPAFRVLGINDYMFVDGYRRLRKEREAGRLQNIQTLLPVVELRLDRFGGTDGQLRRVNLHVIFSDEVLPDVIEDHFVRALASAYRLDPGVENLQWEWGLSREALIDLGRRVKASVPKGELARFHSDLIEGFNHFNVSLDDVQRVLGRTVFDGTHLLAVGKAEWASIKWNEQSVADKKTIINGAAFVFTAAESANAFHASRAALRSAQVNDRLLDCSDAHWLSSASEKDRIGNCFTWINAAPTFEGLRHAMREYGQRVFVGDEPPLVTRVAQNPTRFMKSVRIAAKPAVPGGERWFDVSLELNPGFSVIYGGKGQGKSALADAIALAGGSSRHEYFAFLRPDRFRNARRNHARNYEVALTWCSGDVLRRGLDVDPPAGLAEAVQYIPQGFLEDVCNEVAQGAGSLFTAELNRVVFHHVPDEQRLGTESVEQWIETRSVPIRERIARLRSELAQVNAQVAKGEERLRPEERTRLQSDLSERQRALDALEARRPPEPIPPDEGAEGSGARARTVEDLETTRGEGEQVHLAIEDTRKEIAGLFEREAAADRVLQRLANLRAVVEQFQAEVSRDLHLISVRPEEILAFDLRFEIVRERGATLHDSRVAALARLEGSADSLVEREARIRERQQRLIDELDEPNRRFQTAVRDLEEWERARDRLMGTATTSNSVLGARAALSALERLPEELAEMRATRVKLCRGLHQELRRVADVFREVYQPVSTFIESRPEIRAAMGLNFEVALFPVSFPERFLHFINQGVAGSFMGREEGHRVLEELLVPVDPDSEEAVVAFVEAVDARLREDHRRNPRRPAFAADQVRESMAPSQLSDFLYGLEYLEPRFILQSNGRSLDQLSPGEKGILLLLFYLVVDRRDTPLIVDQPEENLDNETVYELLVSALGSAKARRQLIVVTHNPNLAVAGDADQFIHATKGDQQFVYMSGPLEDFDTNQKVLRVLEGTRPAFLNRSGKYLMRRES